MTQWEYKSVEFEYADPLAVCNQWGEKGWELVQVFPRSAIFKRPLALDTLVTDFVAEGTLLAEETVRKVAAKVAEIQERAGLTKRTTK